MNMPGEHPIDHADLNVACATCGNTYDEPIVVELRGERLTFDCFECAIHRLAPTCPTCGCRVIGHGSQVDDTVYCCASCARRGRSEAPVRDRVDTRSMG